MSRYCTYPVDVLSSEDVSLQETRGWSEKATTTDSIHVSRPNQDDASHSSDVSDATREHNDVTGRPQQQVRSVQPQFRLLSFDAGLPTDRHARLPPHRNTRAPPEKHLPRLSRQLARRTGHCVGWSHDFKRRTPMTSSSPLQIDEMKCSWVQLRRVDSDD